MQQQSKLMTVMTFIKRVTRVHSYASVSFEQLGDE